MIRTVQSLNVFLSGMNTGTESSRNAFCMALKEVRNRGFRYQLLQTVGVLASAVV